MEDRTMAGGAETSRRPTPPGRSGRARRAAAALPFLALLVGLLAAGCALLPGRSGSGATTVEIVSHVVSDGETLASIADDYYGSERAAGYLADINGTTPGAFLEPGSIVEVPVGRDDIERYKRRTEAKLLYNRGTTLAERGDYAKAREEFAAALRADPRFVDAGYNLGVVLMASGEPAGAVAILEQVVAAAPDEPLFEFALGKACHDAGRVPESLTHFERAVELDPTLEDARFARAVALLELSRREDAIVALDSYVRDFPDGTWVDQARAELARLATSVPEPQ